MHKCCSLVGKSIARHFSILILDFTIVRSRVKKPVMSKILGFHNVMVLYSHHNRIMHTVCLLCRERRGVHSISATDRIRDGGGGVLAFGQLLVTRAGGHTGGRLTRVGGRVHARVAPAIRGSGSRQRRFTVAGAAAAGAAACARARSVARCSSPLPRHLFPVTVRYTPSAPDFLTRAAAPLLSAT